MAKSDDDVRREHAIEQGLASYVLHGAIGASIYKGALKEGMPEQHAASMAMMYVVELAKASLAQVSQNERPGGAA